MGIYALTSGLLAIGVAIIHSALGERLVFSRMREGGLVPTSGQPVLRERHVRILWATWHLVSVMGIAFGVILIQASRFPDQVSQFVLLTIAATMLLGAFLVLFATKGRHPGWVGLLGVAVLTFMHLQTS